MARKSAGILLFRLRAETEVFLVHPGGPFYKNKDNGCWSIPKGEFTDDEEPLTAARREFKEETGTAVDDDFIQLSTIKQKGGKMVYAWAVEGDVDAENIVSNNFEMIWPPGSGVLQTFPENDRGAWFSVVLAREKIIGGQVALLDELVRRLEEEI